MELPGFERYEFSAAGLTKTVYRRGDGPAVVLIHELPGMTVECADLGVRLADEGFEVYMPLLFGEPLNNYGVKPLAWGCVWKEFDFLGRREQRPVTEFLRALARSAADATKGKVGAIGMCFTGCFALSMLLEEELIAPVLSQPSPPALSGASLGLRAGELENAKRRVAAENMPVLGFRFEGDKLCTGARFDTLRAEFGANFREVVLPGDKHSVLTMNFRDLSPADRARVWGELLGYLRARLAP